MQPAVWFPRTKLIRPQVPPDLVIDDDLLARTVTAARTVPLTLVRGAAGAGKTTLATAAAAEIAASAGPAGEVGWIRLDELDDDPASLLDLLVAAFDDLVPGGCPGVAELLAAGLPASLDPRRAAGVLVNDLLAADVPDPTVLVLDDLHAIVDPATLAVLDYFVSHLPPSVHLLATSRDEPGLSLSLLRARRQVHEIVDDDLRLGADQAARLLSRHAGRDVDAAEVADILEITGGWVTGIRLHGQDPRALDRYIDDELVALEADDVVTFLAEASILDVLTPDDAMRVTGRPDAADLLDRVHRRFGLFVSVADPSVPAYRLHDLFARRLRARLAATAPSHVAELHRSAASTVESPARQVEHLLTAGAWDEAAERIEAMAGPLPSPAELTRLEGWARQLPVGVRAGHPGIDVLVGAAAAQRGDLDAAVPLLEAGLAALDPTDDATLARRWLAVRGLALSTTDVGRLVPILAEIERSPAFASLPPAVLAGHHVSLAHGALFGGQWPMSTQRVEAAVAVATTTGDLGAIEVLAQHLSPTLLGAPGSIDVIERYASWSEGRVDDHLVGRLGLHHQRAFLSYFRGRLDEAAEQARAAAPLVAHLGGVPYLRGTIEWVLAGAAHARGDHAAAEQILRDGIDAPGSGDLDRELDVFRRALLARVLGHLGKVDELEIVVTWLAARELGRYATYAQVSTLSAHGQLHLARNDLPAAVAAFRDAAALEDVAGVVPFSVLPRLDLALALDRTGRRKEALGELAAGVTRIGTWGAPGLLAAAGPAIAPLLEELDGTVVASALGALDAATAVAPIAVPGTTEVLSAREVEVLRLLATGATNAAIASTLVISAHTAKTHVSHILTKLGASNRGEAVARARADRLI